MRQNRGKNKKKEMPNKEKLMIKQPAKERKQQLRDGGIIAQSKGN
jgi:hypothetical protein